MSKALTVLLVDDDRPLRESLAEQLALHDDFNVVEAENAAQGLEVVRSLVPDIVLLDVGLPDMDGRELCKLMRHQGLKAPIMMITAADSQADTILGLDAGANDYISKPFHFRVLLARLRAHLRQHEQSDDAILNIGPYQFRPAAKILVDKNEKRIKLTEKESAILKHLYRAGNQTIPREALLYEVWGYNAEVSTHTLETHIYRLRQKIEKDPTHAQILLTEGGGYRLQRS